MIHLGLVGCLLVLVVWYALLVLLICPFYLICLLFCLAGWLFVLCELMAIWMSSICKFWVVGLSCRVAIFTGSSNPQFGRFPYFETSQGKPQLNRLHDCSG